MYRGQTRTHIKNMCRGKNYPLCKIRLDDGSICNTPIRPKLYISPSGKISTRPSASSIELNLRYMCEICYKEQRPVELVETKHKRGQIDCDWRDMVCTDVSVPVY